MDEDHVVKLHGLSQFKRLDPMIWDFTPRGKLRVIRWKQGRGYSKPNAVAMEDLKPGYPPDLDIVNGFAEVRNARTIARP